MVSSTSTTPVYDFTPYLLRVTSEALPSTRLARMLVRHARQQPRLLIDCQQLSCLRTRGVGHFVSQLLLLQSVGARIRLSNVDPLLHRTLRLLRLDVVFELLPL